MNRKRGGLVLVLTLLFIITLTQSIFASTTITDSAITTSGNLTAGEKITFSLGEIIDNIVNNWIRVTGSLNITGNATIIGSSLKVNNQEVCLADGTNCIPDTNESSRVTTLESNLDSFKTTVSSDFLNKSNGAENYVYASNHWAGNNTFYNTDSAFLNVNGSLRLQDLFGITQILLNGTSGDIQLNQFTSCNLDTDGSGNLVCGSDADTTYSENDKYLTQTGTVFGFNETALNSTIDSRDDDTTYSHLSNFTDDILWTSSFNTTGDVRWGGGIDTQKTTSGIYLYNDSTTIYLNETTLNSTIDSRDDDTTYDFQCSSGQFVKNLTSSGSYVCDTPSGSPGYVSLYSSGDFNGSLYTTGTDPTASDSNSILQVIGSDGTPRFQVQNGGPEQASFIARSFMVVNQNSTRLNLSQNNLCDLWEFEYIDCNTSTTGADMGVQDDFEAQGLVYSREGVYGETSDWGVYALFGNLSRISSSKNGSYYTSTNYFCDFVSNPFTSANIENENWIKIRSGTYEGAIAEIKSLVNSSCVQLENNPSWDEDLTFQEYSLLNEPNVVFSDGGTYHFKVENNDEAKFEIHIQNATGSKGFYIHDYAGVAQHKATYFSTDVMGFSGVSALLSQIYSSVDVETSDTSNLQLEFIPQNFNNSVHQFMEARISGEKESGMTIDLMNLQGDFDSYIRQGESATISKVYYDNAQASTTDITSSAISQSSNVDIFENDNSILYIGSTTNFTLTIFNLATESSAGIQPEFYYCNNLSNWVAYTNSFSDTTAELTSSGSIIAESPADRGTCNKEIDGTPFADTTNYTYIAIKRTRNNIVTTPVESTISISGGESSFILADEYIKLSGISAPPFTCDASVDGAIYYDTDTQFHCSCKSGTGWVQMDDYTSICS